MSEHVRVRQAWATVAAAALLLTAACSPGGHTAEPPPPRPVTVEESELLANVRSRNSDVGSRAIVVTYADQEHDLELEGWFDYATRTGYALLSVDGLPRDRVTWNGKVVATTAGTQLGKPLTSLDGWQAARLDPRNSPLSVVLTVLAGLGADQPENPRPIRQGGALWLREDTSGGRAVTVFAGPATQRPEAENRTGRTTRPHAERSPGADTAGIRYWVDDTGLAHRVDIRLGEEWAAVTLTNDDVQVPALLKNVDLSRSQEPSGR